MIVNAKAWDSVTRKMYDAIISDICDWCIILDEHGQNIFDRTLSIDVVVLCGFTIYPG